MACERYRDALSDVAAGAGAAAGLETHLAACAACRAELAALREALAAADAELARLLAAEPSPALATRIRAALAQSPRGRAWELGWLWPSLAAAALLVAFVVVAGRAPQEPAVAVERESPPPPTAAPVPEPAVEPSAAPPAPRAREPEAGPRLARRRPEPAQPEVLVPPGEAEALLRLVAVVHSQRLAPGALGSVGERSPDLAELRPIDIPPLEIVPLDPAETGGT